MCKTKDEVKTKLDVLVQAMNRLAAALERSYPIETKKLTNA